MLPLLLDATTESLSDYVSKDFSKLLLIFYAINNLNV